MPYKSTNPTYNVDRKVVNFKDFATDKEKLAKAELQRKPNSENQQNIGNKRTEYNPVTHKLTDYSDDEIKDRLDSIEELEGTNESIDIEDIKMEISNAIQAMTQDRHSPKLYKWLNSLSEEELNVIYSSIEKNGLLSKI